ncbi:dienelactone hydrolase family protein [Jatrophihabitans sp. YIM 134969]
MTTPLTPTEVEIPSFGTPGLRGWLVLPEGESPFPAVVVVHEAFGVDEVMKRQAVRLARAGFVALLPDLFTAGGPRRCLVSTMRALRSGHGRVYADIEAARGLAVDLPESTGKVGVVGFCMGGGFALMTATRGFDVAAANYGVVPKDPVHALAGACPVIGSYGGADRFLGKEKPPRQLEQALTEAHVEHRVDVYPGAGHSFLNDAPVGPAWMQSFERVMNVGPVPEAATVAWEQIDTFLHAHLD